MRVLVVAVVVFLCAALMPPALTVMTGVIDVLIIPSAAMASATMKMFAPCRRVPTQASVN